jgi:F-type H+-transporting ATPase subunit delta
MNNPRLAGRYAKSLLDLAIEQDQLDAVYQDMKMVKQLCHQNPDFTAVLKSPVITADKKEKIIAAVLLNKVNKLTGLFITLLINKTRESNLPEISDTFIRQYNELKNIHKVKITTAVPMSKELEDAMVSRIRTNADYQNIELETVVDESLIGGYKFEMGDMLIDASILRDLNDVKKQFMSNEYIHKLR